MSEIQRIRLRGKIEKMSAKVERMTSKVNIMNTKVAIERDKLTKLVAQENEFSFDEISKEESDSVLNYMKQFKNDWEGVEYNTHDYNIAHQQVIQFVFRYVKVTISGPSRWNINTEFNSEKMMKVLENDDDDNESPYLPMDIVVSMKKMGVTIEWTGEEYKYTSNDGDVDKTFTNSIIWIGEKAVMKFTFP